MSVLKRTEVWILLLLVAGGLLWAFLRPDDDDSNSNGRNGSASLSVQKLEIRRDGDHALLTLHASAGREKPITAGEVRLLSNGSAVPEFIRPFKEIAPAAPDGSLRLDYWLAATHLTGPLELEAAGSLIPVKGATAFPLDRLPDRQTVALKFPDWKLP